MRTKLIYLIREDIVNVLLANSNSRPNVSTRFYCNDIETVMILKLLIYNANGKYHVDDNREMIDF